jgi:hypothetical protein
MTGRERLAARQAALLRALVGGGVPPPGFDTARVKAERTALRAKRRRLVAQLRPDLARDLGDRFDRLFDHYAADHARTEGQRAREDADAFAAWLTVRREWRPPRRRWLPGRRRASR